MSKQIFFTRQVLRFYDANLLKLAEIQVQKNEILLQICFFSTIIQRHQSKYGTFLNSGHLKNENTLPVCTKKRNFAFYLSKITI